MNSFFLRSALTAALVFSAHAAHAGGSAKPPATPPAYPPISIAEPSFCDPAAFYAAEVPLTDRIPAREVKNYKRAHAFKFGELTFVALAVGVTEVVDLEKMAMRYANPAPQEKYCTWYFNKGEKDHRDPLNWHYLNKPNGSIPPRVDEYESVLRGVFTENPTSLLSCAENNRFFAFGCGGQKHRGPTAFVMFLSYLGCAPHKALEIALHYWDRNGIDNDMRIAVGVRGREMGERDPASRQRFLDLMQVP